MTYGLERAEILSAQFNGATLLVLGLLIVYEGDPPPHRPARRPRRPRARRRARRHRRQPRRDAGRWRSANRRSLNVEGAFQHILTDLAAFIATAVAGVVILADRLRARRRDRLAVVAAIMLRAAYGLLRGLRPRVPRGRAGRHRRRRDRPRDGRARPASSRCTTCTCGRSRPASRRCPRTCSSARDTTATTRAARSSACCTTIRDRAHDAAGRSRRRRAAVHRGARGSGAPRPSAHRPAAGRRGRPRAAGRSAGALKASRLRSTSTTTREGTAPPLRAYRLQTEPWLFVIAKNGRVAARLEGSFGLDAFERAVVAGIARSG